MVTVMVTVTGRIMVMVRVTGTVKVTVRITATVKIMVKIKKMYKTKRNQYKNVVSGSQSESCSWSMWNSKSYASAKFRSRPWSKSGTGSHARSRLGVWAKSWPGIYITI